MSQQVVGNCRGLSQAQIKKVERLYKRFVDKEKIVSLELAREMCALAHDLGRRIGVLISREGAVEEVVLGAKDILYLPDLGRYRFGSGRLRRLRLVFVDLSKHEQAHIPADIYTDLEKLRLDMVVAIKQEGSQIACAFAHLLPLNAQRIAEASVEQALRTESIKDLSRLKFNFESFIQELEVQLEETLAERRSKTLARSSLGAVLIGVYETSLEQAEASIAELEELAETAGVRVLDKIIQRKKPDPRSLLGRGKIEQVVLQCLRLGADLLIFDNELRPAQWRVITNSTELKVIDRSMLILDIFAQRASSSEGRIQVELAQLKYNLPRLVEKDAGLSRLSGGIGGRGPGETKLEIGRRRIRDRIADLERRIGKIGAERELRSKRRHDNALPLVTILGYTNVGKSTLFNLLSKSSVLVEDKLFATLDPAQRRVDLSALYQTGTGVPFFILSDTVGFIRNLPVELKSAFRATLEQLHSADLFLHVLDASDCALLEKKRAVDQLIAEMKLEHIPEIVVLNKIDKVSEERRRELELEFNALGVSALKKEGIENLLIQISDILGAQAKIPVLQQESL